MIRELLLLNSHLGDPLLEQLTKDYVSEQLSSSIEMKKDMKCLPLYLLLQLHWQFYKYHKPKSLRGDPLGSAL